MRIGVASVDITPALGLPMDGFEARTAGASGVHDPLVARVLAAEGVDGTTVALVVADLLQIDPGLQALIADRVDRTAGISRQHLQLAGTHTHSGPRVDPGSALEARLADRIASAVQAAVADLRPAAIAVGIGTVSGIGANRRPRGGPMDDRVTVVRIDALDGSPIATLVNYGCHPTTLGPDNMLYSADYPGVLRRELEAAIGGVALFTTGPQGDVNPGGYSPEDSMIGIVVPWRTFESAERYGRLLADSAVAVHRTLRPAPADDVWGVSDLVELARKPLPDPATAQHAAEAARAVAETVRAADLTPDASYHALLAAAYAELIALQAGAADRDDPVAIRASAIGIGPFVHVGIGGELFVELGRKIRAAVGDTSSCVAALCDGTIGYIPTAEVFAEGGYEPNASVLRPGEGERLVDAVVARVAAARVAAARGATAGSGS